MEFTISIEDLYYEYEDKILKSTKEYNEGVGKIDKLQEKIKKDFDLKDSQKEEIDELIDTVFDTECLLHKQAFVIGFRVAKSLLIE